MSSPPTLDRSIGLVHATAMVAGIMIGASIFVQPSEIARYVPSVSGTLGVWLVAGCLTLCGAMVSAELAAIFPRTGGVYVFLQETLSPAWGFLWGWAMFWSVHSGIIAATSVIFARYVAFFARLDDLGIRACAIAGILALSAVNYLGVRQGSRLQTIVTAAKLAAILLILALVFLLGRPPAVGPAVAASPPAASSFLLAISAGLFAFGGWHMVTYAAGETRSPEKTIPRALLAGTLIVTACYLALNGAFLYLLPLDRLISSPRAAADAAAVIAGERGAALVSALVILSSLGVLNGVILAGPRLYYAMARQGQAFRALAVVHPRFHTPHLAILAQAIWSCVLVATGTYRELFTRVVYTEWLFFALMAAGLLRRGARHPIVPIIFLVACVAVAGGQIAADPRSTSAGLLLVVLGYPVYRFLVRPHAHH